MWCSMKREMNASARKINDLHNQFNWCFTLRPLTHTNDVFGGSCWSYPFGLDICTSEYAGAQGTARWGMSKLKHVLAKGEVLGAA